jgi:uracil phosphoribosyltransferase
VLHLGLFREKATLQPVEYYNKLPQERPHFDQCFILDPMVATAGTAIATVNILKDWGLRGAQIKLICICASREGIEHLVTTHPDITVHTCVIDDELDGYGYVIPGLGDAGKYSIGLFYFGYFECFMFACLVSKCHLEN